MNFIRTNGTIRKVKANLSRNISSYVTVSIIMDFKPVSFKIIDIPLILIEGYK